MASEKQNLLHNAHMMNQPLSKPHNRRRKLFMAFGVGLFLLTGLAATTSLSPSCRQAVKDGLQRRRSSAISTESEVAIQELAARDVDTPEVLAPRDWKPKARPNKNFGPNSAIEEARHKKEYHYKGSVYQRDSETEPQLQSEPVLETPESLEIRNNIEKRGVWQPAPGLTWTYQLSKTPTAAQLANPAQYQVWGLDLFDTPASSIKTIQAAGSKVVCYFSGGTYEDWRTDGYRFTDSDKGNAMGDWPGETWINTNSANVRSIMLSRLRTARLKGCDAVDPDNMDSYNHDTGFGLSQADAVSYVTYLAQQASAMGLAISLKNSGEIIPQVLNKVQFSVEEACGAYNECIVYKPFTDAGKAVFHVEYPKGYGVVNTKNVSKSTMDWICSCIPKWNFSPIVKNNNLDTWQQKCQ